MKLFPISLLLFLAFFYSCGNIQESETNTTEIKKPNILWLIAEDISPYLSAFGDSTVSTPNIDRLAAQGVRYTNVYSPSGVCAPSRAAIATGMYPSGIGANHMRTNSHTQITGLPPYEAVPPAQVKMFNELLRENGYYCTNNAKEDYQFTAPPTAWDANGLFAHWRNRDPEQPFFSVFSFMTTHESGLFEPYGVLKNELRFYAAGDTSFQLAGHPYQKTSGEETPIHISKSTEFQVPPYLPDNDVVQNDLWKMYNNIAEMDKQIGAILDQLEADGLLEETVIFFFSDHGGPLPRQKRLIYDAGLRVPMIVRFPNKVNAGKTDDQLISFVDFAPTVLELGGVDLPGYLQGQSFLDKRNTRRYIHAAADRFDGHTDVIRAVRDDRFKYIRNYRPKQGYYLPITFRERIPSMQELLRLRDIGGLNEVQSQWFREEKVPEELYDCINDPHELNNLADQNEYKEKLIELREEMDRWLLEIGDKPNQSESELISKLWKNAELKPKTATPKITIEDGKAVISCTTEGASIGYKITGENRNTWNIYNLPLELNDGTGLEVLAHRIGYMPSDTASIILK